RCIQSVTMLSTLHKCSALGVKNDLELFDLPPTQFSHEGHEFLEFYPSSSKPEETDAIEFHIPNVGKNYLDPSAIFLYVKAKIVRGGGGSVTRQRSGRDTFKTEETSSGSGTQQQQQQQSTGSGTQQQSTSSGTP